jgi:ribose transport system permease protein
LNNEQNVSSDKDIPSGQTFLMSLKNISVYQILVFLRTYAVLIFIVLLTVILTIISDSFLTPRNLLNILNQNAPLAIIASALTLVIIGGGFDLSTGAMFGVASVCAAWLAVNINPQVAFFIAPIAGLVLGIVNGLLITGLRVHSFLATLASSLVFRGIAILITGGFLIPVRIKEFSWLGRSKVYEVHIAVLVFITFAVIMGFLLKRTTFGRYVFAVGGNEEAAILSGINISLIKISTFALTGMAAGIAGVITVSRISMGQPQAGEGLGLQAIAAVILGGTSIYGGAGAVWRSVAGVMLLALINNGFNILNVNPFYKDLSTGLIIVLAVALSAAGSRKK